MYDGDYHPQREEKGNYCEIKNYPYCAKETKANPARF